MSGNRQFLRIFLLLRVFLTHFIHVPYPRFIPKSAFYPHIRVLSSYPRFIPISAFYPHIRVLSPYPCFIPISAFYPQIRVLSPYPCFIPISAPPIRSAPSIRPSAPRFILTRLKCTTTSFGELIIELHCLLHCETLYPASEVANIAIFVHSKLILF